MTEMSVPSIPATTWWVILCGLTPCDDGDACTQLDLCANGLHGPAAGEYGGGDPCTEDDSCNPVTGNCDFPGVTQALPCDDGNACTSSDKCEGATCTGTVGVTCDDGDACTNDSCDPETGCTATAIVCEDDNVCTTNSCAPATGCIFTNKIGTPCDDGNACTENEVCTNVSCSGGVESDCNDGNPCTQDFCNVLNANASPIRIRESPAMTGAPVRRTTSACLTEHAAREMR